MGNAGSSSRDEGYASRFQLEQSQRLISALIILPPLVLFLYYAPPVLFFFFILLVVSLSLREYFRLMALTQQPLCAGESYVVAFLCVTAAYSGSPHWFPLVMVVGMMTLTVSVMLKGGDGVRGFAALLHCGFGVFFIAGGMSHLVLLRGLTAGERYVLLLCAVVWLGDSAAMYVGKAIGRHKMAPAISPGKTWEGAAGCVLGCVLTAMLGSRLLSPHLSTWHSMILGVFLALAAQISDLSESLIKRYAGVKDSGELIPGHGGLLDRIDSMLLAAPVMVYTLYLLLPSP